MRHEIIRVLVVDDHDLVRTGLKAFLREDERLEVVGEAADGREAVEKAELLRPEVILMNPEVPGADGVEAIRTLRRHQPAAQIVILGSTGASEAAVAALRAGALGLVGKTAPRAAIRAVVHRAARGEPWIPPGLAYELVRRESPARTLSELTRRELEILRLVAAGLTNRQIARKAHVCEATVRTHMTHILDKLGAENRVQAALCAWRAGLVPTDGREEPGRPG